MSSSIRRRLLLLGCIAVLLVQLVVQIRLAVTDSQTTDEAVHLSAGYTYLTRGDFRFNPEHPPLIKILAALPLLVIKLHLDPSAEKLWNQSSNFFYDSWKENRQFGEILLYGSGNNPDQIMFWARLPMVLLTLALGVTILLINYRHWGAGAAFVATTLYAFNPTVNGHGHLITTDIGLALGFLLSVYSFWQFMRQPSWPRALYFGLSFALALLIKHTAVILLPVFLLIAIMTWFDKTRQAQWSSTLVKFVASLVLVIILIWAGFGFHDRVVPQTNSVSSAITLAGNQSGVKLVGPSNPQPVVVAKPGLDKAYHAIRPFLTILPGDYLKGLLMVVGHASNGQDSFLLGQISNKGWWYYFPLLILFKTPLAVLLILLAAVYILCRYRPLDRLAISLAIGAAVFLLVAMNSKADLGIRHIMPIFPPLFIVAGWAATRYRQATYVVAALLVWLVVVFGLSYPTYLGYFNELASGSGNGYLIATDSNLDWGQDLKRIKSYVETNHLSPVYIEYGWLGNRALDYYLGANNYHLLTDWVPGETGYVIIGATAYNNDEFSYLYNCAGRVAITNGAFMCPLKK